MVYGFSMKGTMVFNVAERIPHTSAKCVQVHIPKCHALIILHGMSVCLDSVDFTTN